VRIECDVMDDASSIKSCLSLCLVHVAAIVHVVVFLTCCLLVDVCAHILLWLVDFYWWLEHPLILQPCNKHWNSVSMNLPPLSRIYRAGRGCHSDLCVFIGNVCRYLSIADPN
jgi:hypothetical protein